MAIKKKQRKSPIPIRKESVKPILSKPQIQQKMTSNSMNQCLEVMTEVNNKSGANAVSNQELNSLCQKLLSIG